MVFFVPTTDLVVGVGAEVCSLGNHAIRVKQQTGAEICALGDKQKRKGKTKGCDREKKRTKTFGAIKSPAPGHHNIDLPNGGEAHRETAGERAILPEDPRTKLRSAGHQRKVDMVRPNRFE